MTRPAELDWTPGAPDAPRAGMLLRYKDGDVLLVGHMNTEGGGCGCCNQYDRLEVAAWTTLPLPEGVTL